jgi:hypothetical protein
MIYLSLVFSLQFRLIVHLFGSRSTADPDSKHWSKWSRSPAPWFYKNSVPPSFSTIISFFTPYWLESTPSAKLPRPKFTNLGLYQAYTDDDTGTDSSWKKRAKFVILFTAGGCSSTPQQAQRQIKSSFTLFWQFYFVAGIYLYQCLDWRPDIEDGYRYQISGRIFWSKFIFLLKKYAINKETRCNASFFFF